MKWASLARGKRARKKGIEVHPLDAEKPVTADFRVLDGADHGRVLEYAAFFAKEKGGEPKEGDSAFEFGKAVMTVVLALTDSDSPDDRPEQFFANPAELFEALDADRIMSLAHQQRFFQDVVSPSPFTMSAAEFTKHVVDLATSEEGEEHPFVKWRPAFALSFTRSLAKKFWLSLQDRLSTSSTDESATPIS